MSSARESSDELGRAIAAFDAAAFARRHGGYKESPSDRSHEYVMPCSCGGNRLRWNAQKGAWRCWSHPRDDPRGSRGGTLDLIQQLEGCDELGAIDIVMAGYVGGDARIEHLPTEKLREHPRRAGPRALRRLPAIPWPHGVDRLTDPHCAPHAVAWAYLGRRGITVEDVRSYGLGFGRSGRLSGYVVFPVVMDHALVYWQGRATWDPPANLGPEARKLWVSSTRYRKTLNPVAVEGSEAATAEEVVFNADRASVAETVVICEGPVDACKVGPHAVALFGKVAQPAKVERLRRMRASTFVVYLDRGEQERECALQLAAELAPYARVRIATPPPGYDAGALSRAQNAAVIAGAEIYRSGKLTTALREPGR